jgi:hypothetical protein
MRARILDLCLVAMPAAFAMVCRTEPPDIIVEADTTMVASGPARPMVQPAPAPAAPEVIVIEERAAVEPALAVEPPARDPAPSPGDPSGAGVPSPQLTDPEPVASLSEPPVLPAATRIALELRTPLHSGTTRVGDRFAARTVEPLAIGGRTLVEPGALVEGRVAAVVRAGEAGEPGRIELDFRDLVLAGGERVPLDAEIASVAGREAEPSEAGPVEVVGGAAGGAVLGGAVGGKRGAVIGAVIGAVGATLIANARDHEVVVPSGTPMEITLTAPLEIPEP